MIDMTHDLPRLARVRDDELDGVASGPAAADLLAALVAEPVPTTRRPVARRLVWAAAVAVVAIAALVIGPALVPGGATSYANSAIEINREGHFYVARIKDPLAEHARYVEAFRAVGLDVDIELVPVSPRLVGVLLYSGGGGGGFGGTEVMTDLDCAAGPGHCTIVIKIAVGSTGWNRFTIGRAPQPGEAVQDPQVTTGGPSVNGPSASAGGGN